jgi:dTMP kinase
MTFVLDVDADTARARMQKPRRPDRMEQEPAEFYELVRQAYRQLVAREPKRVVLIDASRSVADISDEIWATLAKRFPVFAGKSEIGNLSEPSAPTSQRPKSGM